jgi:PiT family inorganic phosphate transporter
MIGAIVLFVVVVAFAWNLGAHYTGAVMGMPYAARAITRWPALALIAVFTILGATFASGGVEQTVGLHIIAERFVTVPDAIVIVLAAGALTMLYTYLRLPTSTIQIFVSCIVGVGLAGDIPIEWGTIGALAIVWVAAPIVACGLGFFFTRLLDLLIPPAAARAETQAQLAVETAHQPPISSPIGLERAIPAIALAQRLPPAVDAAAGKVGPATMAALRLLPTLLVLVGMFASFVLGANDVANATGVFILTRQFPLMVAGLIGGIAMAIGALTWGRRILHTVAFDVVTMDLTMASAAQGVQGLVVLAAVTQGFFTSMNQALIGAMAGTGLARGRQTVKRQQIFAIVRGWLIGPFSGIALAYALESLIRLLALR